MMEITFRKFSIIQEHESLILNHKNKQLNLVN